MALYIYAPRLSEASTSLATELDARILRKFDGMDFWKKGKRFMLAEGDIVVCWGRPLPEFEGVRVLNGGDPSSRPADCSTLVNLGINAVPCRKSQYPGYNFARSYKSHGGEDMIVPPSSPDYWTSKCNLTNEYRVHMFEGRAIRTGEKVVRDGWTLATNEQIWKENWIGPNPMNLAHPWVRTFQFGWTINYEGFKCSPSLKKVAQDAVKALELTFGAVDVGYQKGARHTIIKVDRGPKIHGTTLNSYVRAINRWIKEEKPEEEVVEGTEIGTEPQAESGGLSLDLETDGVPIAAPIMYQYATPNNPPPMNDAQPLRRRNLSTPPTTARRPTFVSNGSWAQGIMEQARANRATPRHPAISQPIVPIAQAAEEVEHMAIEQENRNLNRFLDSLDDPNPF